MEKRLSYRLNQQTLHDQNHMGKIRKLPQHNPQNYLKVILESIQLYNSHARADIANWLYEGYKVAEKREDKKTSKDTIILELLSKWIQVFEEIALLGIMFAGYLINDKREPFEIYTKYGSQQIAKFLKVAKRGLPKKALTSIYALPTPRELVTKGIINRNEYSYFTQELNGVLKSGKTTFFNIAREFVGRKRRNKNQVDFGQIVQLYFNTKHGFKVIHPTETAKQLWKNIDHIVIAEKVEITKWRRKVLKVRGFTGFTSEDVDTIIKRINGWSDVVREIADAHLKYLDNPYFLVPLIRAKKTRELLKAGKMRPGRNDTCLCGSQKKFKRCCEGNL